jgi:hypothetical protein
MSDNKTESIVINAQKLQVGDVITGIVMPAGIPHPYGDSRPITFVDGKGGWAHAHGLDPVTNNWSNVLINRRTTTDPRILHDFGDGTVAVKTIDVGPRQPRSGNNSTIASLIERENDRPFSTYRRGPGVYDTIGKGGEYPCRVRQSELPPLPGQQGMVPAAQPVILPCVGPSVDDLRKASPLFASLREQVTEGLTKAKRDEASAAWSVALRKLQEKSKQEAREKGRTQVVVDYDYDLMMVKVD